MTYPQSDIDLAQSVIDLALSMNVSPADVVMLAQSINNSIEQDKATQAFIDSSEDERADFTSAYLKVAVRKFESFQSKYQTDSNAAKTFNLTVLELLRCQF